MKLISGQACCKDSTETSLGSIDSIHNHTQTPRPTSWNPIPESFKKAQDRFQGDESTKSHDHWEDGIGQKPSYSELHLLGRGGGMGRSLHGGTSTILCVERPQENSCPFISKRFQLQSPRKRTHFSSLPVLSRTSLAESRGVRGTNEQPAASSLGVPGGGGGGRVRAAKLKGEESPGFVACLFCQFGGTRSD